MSGKEVPEHHEWYAAFLERACEHLLRTVLVGAVADEHAMKLHRTMRYEAIGTHQTHPTGHPGSFFSFET